MKIKSWLYAIPLTLIASLSYATVPTNESIQKLFKVMNIAQLTQDTIKQIHPQLLDQSKQMVRMVVNSESLDSNQQKIAEELANNMLKQALDMTSWEKLLPIYTQVYKESFTEEEINAQTKFYSTAMGQSILKKTPVVAEKTMAFMNKGMQEAIMSQSKEYKVILDKLKKQ